MLIPTVCFCWKASWKILQSLVEVELGSEKAAFYHKLPETVLSQIDGNSSDISVSGIFLKAFSLIIHIDYFETNVG